MKSIRCLGCGQVWTQPDVPYFDHDSIECKCPVGSEPSFEEMPSPPDLSDLPPTITDWARRWLTPIEDRPPIGNTDPCKACGMGWWECAAKPFTPCCGMYWQGRYDAADAIEEFAEDAEHTVEHVQALTAAAQIARGSDECTAAVHDADRLTAIEGETPQ